VTEPERITAHTHDMAHTAEGLGLLISALRGKPVMGALLTTWLDQVQEVEDALWILYGLGIDDSSDHALDQIGVVLGHPRPDSLSDALYRRVLHAVVIALRSSGTGPDLLAAMRALLGSYAFTMIEAYPATVLFEPTAAPDLAALTMLGVLRRVRSGGVGLQLVDVPSGDTFGFSADAEVSSTDSARGFSTTAGLVGGRLVGMVATT
jgi:hypothetical protein